MALPSDDARIKYYLGAALRDEGSQFDLDSGAYAPAHFQTTANLVPSGPEEPVFKRGYNRALYDTPLLELLDSTGHSDRPFLYAGNDRVAPDVGPVLVKNRRGSAAPVLLRCLNEPRHWSSNATPDPDFRLKRDIVYWRGGSSGWEYRPSSRMALVRRWAKKRPDIDVMFSHLCQEYALPGVRERWVHFVDGRASRATFLRHKYIVSAEGNDKDSGLNWKLRANSVVMMPRPVAESWLMEPFLVPFVHYVPLNDDFSDLGERLSWCRANQARCERIIAAAHAFMEQFEDIENERRIERAVVNTYFERVRGGTRLGKKPGTPKVTCPSAPISGTSSRARRAKRRCDMRFTQMRLGSAGT